MLWWLFPQKIFINTCIKISSVSVFTSYAVRIETYNFYSLILYKYSASDLEKKNKMVTAAWQQKRNSIGIGSTKYLIQYFPCTWVEYCERWVKLQFRIRRSTLETCSGNIWSRLISPTINFLCGVGNSLINEIKSYMKEPRRPGTQYFIANKTVSFSISNTIGNIFKTPDILVTSMMFTLLTF